VPKGRERWDRLLASSHMHPEDRGRQALLRIGGNLRSPNRCWRGNSWGKKAGKRPHHVLQIARGHHGGVQAGDIPSALGGFTGRIHRTAGRSPCCTCWNATTLPRRPPGRRVFASGTPAIRVQLLPSQRRGGGGLFLHRPSGFAFPVIPRATNGAPANPPHHSGKPRAGASNRGEGTGRPCWCPYVGSSGRTVLPRKHQDHMPKRRGKIIPGVVP